MIIGLSGKAGSGKDTVGDYIAKKYNFAKMAFADPVKRTARMLFDFSDEALWGPSDKRKELNYKYKLPQKYQTSDNPSFTKYLSARTVLQKLGTEFGRECYENIWVDLVLKDVYAIEKEPRDNFHCVYNYRTGLDRTRKRILNPYNGVIITDLRFFNEVAAVKSADVSESIVIKIVRDKINKNDEFRSHISETELDEIPDSEFTHIIENNSSLESLKEKIDNIIKKHE